MHILILGLAGIVGASYVGGKFAGEAGQETGKGIASTIMLAATIGAGYYFLRKS